MEQEFLRPLIVALLAGVVIAGVGGSLLFFVFRALAEGRKSERKYVILAAALLSFVFLCCAIIFVISLR